MKYMCTVYFMLIHLHFSECVLPDKMLFRYILLVTCTLFVRVYSQCLLHTDQILACDRYKNITQYQLSHNKPFHNDDNYNTACRGYFYCLDTSYCHHRHGKNKNLTCNRTNDNILSCRCSDHNNCYKNEIKCYNIIDMIQYNNTWSIPKYYSRGLKFCKNNFCCHLLQGCHQLTIINYYNNHTNKVFLNMSTLKSVKHNRTNTHLSLDLSRFGELEWLPLQLGMKCDIMYINISYNYITSHYNYSFYFLYRLQVADISYNNITHLGPYAFYLCYQLLSLNISGNNIQHIGDHAFHSCASLPMIDLSDHDLHSIGSSVFHYCEKLTHLDLAEKNIKIISPKAFRFMSSLISLNLTGTCIEIIGESAFDGLDSIDTLNLSNLCIHTIHVGFVIATFGDMPKLTSLDLSQNSITVLLSRTFVRLPALMYFNLSCNCLQHTDMYTLFQSNILTYDLSFQCRSDSIEENRMLMLSPNMFTGLTNMKNLNLTGNNITRIESNTFIGLSLFLELNISHRGLSSIMRGSFRGLGNVTYLDIAFNEISYLPSYGFEGLTNLRDLILVGNCIQRFESNCFLGTPSFTGPIKLRSLNMSGLCIDNLPNKSFIGLNNVQSVDLSNNGIVNIEPGVIDGIVKIINYLDISQNEIGELPDTIMVEKHVEVLLTDEFRLCCALNRSASAVINHCYPLPDQFSSCDHLLSNIVMRIMIWIIGLTSIVGNALVILVLYRKEFHQFWDFLMTNLAITELLIGAYVCIISSIDQYYREVFYKHAHDWLNGTYCKMAGTLYLFSTEVGLVILSVVSIQRCLITCTNQKINNFENGNEIKLIVYIIWVIIFTLSLLPFLSQQFVGVYSNNSVCMPFTVQYSQIDDRTNTSVITSSTNVYTDGILVCNFLICVVIIVLQIVYLFGVKHCGQQKKAQCCLRSKMDSDINNNRATTWINFTFICVWLPIFILTFLEIVINISVPADMSAWLSLFWLPLKSSINPCILLINTWSKC